MKVDVLQAMLNESVTFYCNHSCKGLSKWTYNEEYLVIQCKQSNCEEGKGFNNRVRISNEKEYSLDLTINPVEFGDQGVFVGSCDDKEFFDFRLEVLGEFFFLGSPWFSTGYCIIQPIAQMV